MGRIPKTRMRHGRAKRTAKNSAWEQAFQRDWIKVRDALRDLLRFYDRAAGNPGHTGHGWTVAEVLRIKEIREMACPERSEG